MRQYGVRTALRSPGEAAGFLPGARQRPGHQWPPDRWTSHLFLPLTFLPSQNLPTKNHGFGHLLPLLTSYLLPSYLSPNLVLKKNCVFVLWKFCHLVTGEQDTSHLCNELNFVFNPNFVTDLILYFLGEIWPPSQKLKFGQQNNNALVTWKVDKSTVTFSERHFDI